jgi:hypothetical protein
MSNAKWHSDTGNAFRSDPRETFQVVGGVQRPGRTYGPRMPNGIPHTGNASIFSASLQWVKSDPEGHTGRECQLAFRIREMNKAVCRMPNGIPHTGNGLLKSN